MPIITTGTASGSNWYAARQPEKTDDAWSRPSLKYLQDWDGEDKEQLKLLGILG